MNSAISISWVDWASTAFNSSGENITYCPLANSKPLAISSRGTISSSWGQTYCCLTRAPHFLCSMLKRIAADDSPDV